MTTSSPDASGAPSIADCSHVLLPLSSVGGAGCPATRSPSSSNDASRGSGSHRRTIPVGGRVARMQAGRGQGGGSGEPLVLIHGFSATWPIWDPIRPRLEASHDVLAVALTDGSLWSSHAAVVGARSWRSPRPADGGRTHARRHERDSCSSVVTRSASPWPP